MKLFRRRMRRRNRSLITALLIGVASLFLVVYLMEIPSGEVLRIFFLTVVFVLIIIVLSITSIVLVKALGRLLRKFQ